MLLMILGPVCLGQVLTCHLQPRRYYVRVTGRSQWKAAKV